MSFERIRHIQKRLTLVSGDILDQASLVSVLQEHQPQEVYNLAAQSFVPASWSQSVFTGEVTALGVTRLLNAIRQVDPKIRFYQASSSEMFGKVREVPQDENTPFYPRSPYVRVDSRFIRPTEVDLLVSSPTKARDVLGWEPTISFEDLVIKMVEADLKRLQAEELFP